jgi:hypothetical protein
VPLGPKGRNVVLDKSYGVPRISKDGVTVAKEIERDKFDEQDLGPSRRRHRHRDRARPRYFQGRREELVAGSGVAI